jgi:ketosteroid isomerase-like protein
LAAPDFDETVKRYHAALGEFVKGNPEPIKSMHSHRDDMSLANPFGGAARGWDKVADTLQFASSQFRDGEVTSFEIISEHVGPELAYIAQMERTKVKVRGGKDLVPHDVRATIIFRLEEGEWKVVHRHADYLTTLQPPESVIKT